METLLASNDFQKGDPFATRAGAFGEANQSLPNARKLERDTLFDLFDYRPGMHVVDLQAASGFVSDGLVEKYGENIQITCVEPSRALAEILVSKYKTICCPLEKLEISPNSVDAILCLAGTHHSTSLENVVQSCYESLVPGGQCLLSEVEKDSAMDYWLNEFVDHWTNEGHDGKFPRRGDLSALLAKSDFHSVTEKQVQVPWKFNSYDQAVDFCQQLFGLSKASREQVEAGIDTYLNLHKSGREWQLDWQLLFSSGLK